jgi:hypothetical protein
MHRPLELSCRLWAVLYLHLFPDLCKHYHNYAILETGVEIQLAAACPPQEDALRL